MNSIVYNKYPIMIAPAGNPPLALLSSTPPSPFNQSTPLLHACENVYTADKLD